jgi:excisionase family DNA binding protein
MNEIMTLTEVADYLKIATKTVSRMIQRNEIPCVKISGQWRFKKSTIDQWLDNNMNNKTNTTKENISNSSELSFLPIYKLIDEKMMVLDIKDGSTNEILKQLTTPLIENGYLDNTDTLVENLKVREQMASTAVSKGAAFPHCRKSSDNPKNLPPVILGISQKGINYNLKNNEKIYIFFLILIDDEILHLRILSKLAQFIHQDNIVEQIKNKNTKNEIINFLMEKEYENMA